jgi:tetratricopeptide (TPR) repeat protein
VRWVILGQHFSAQTMDQNREEGRWDSALERAICTARTEACEESYKALKDLLVPFLARPQALATLLDLAARWDPDGRKMICELMKKWVESAQALGREEESTCWGPPVVSRTLADLFYKQGHRDEAKRLYKSLLKRNPQDQAALKEYQERFRERDSGWGEGELLRSLQEMVKRIRIAKMGPRAGEQGPSVEQTGPQP